MAIAIYMNDVTTRMKAKLQKMQIREKKQESMQAESYKSTINHEFRTPLESSTAILAQAIDILREPSLSKH